MLDRKQAYLIVPPKRVAVFRLLDNCTVYSIKTTSIFCALFSWFPGLSYTGPLIRGFLEMEADCLPRIPKSGSFSLVP